MNTATVAVLRRLGLALAIGGIAAGGAFTAASAQVGATGADDGAAAQSAPAAGAPDMPPPDGAPPQGGGDGRHRGFGGAHGGPGFGPGGPRGWHHGGPMGRHRGFGHDRGMMMDRGFLAALRELKLTPVQREQMRTIMFNAREAVRMERANAQQSGAAEHRREDFAVLSNPGDPNYARAVQQLKSRLSDRVQQAITRASETEQKLYNVLTAEQKAQLPKALSDLQARHEQRMQAMRMHRQRWDSGAGENAPTPAPQ